MLQLDFSPGRSNSVTKEYWLNFDIDSFPRMRDVHYYR